MKNGKTFLSCPLFFLVLCFFLTPPRVWYHIFTATVNENVFVTKNNTHECDNKTIIGTRARRRRRRRRRSSLSLSHTHSLSLSFSRSSKSYAMVLSSLTSYVLKKGGRPPSKQAAYGMLVGLFVLNIAYVSMKATLESKKEEEEKILDARERLMSGRGLRGEVLYFDDEKTWDKRRRRRSTEEEDKEEG